MKLLRYGLAGADKPGVLDEHGVIRNLSGIIDDVAGKALLPECLLYLQNFDES